MRFVRALAVLAGMVVLGAQAGSAQRAESPTGDPAAVDIWITFDTTGSMKEVIRRAEGEVTAVVEAVRSVAPDAWFAVSAFSDRFYPQPEYKLLQPMTADPAAVQAAVAAVEAGSTNDRRNTKAEGYNLIFRRSYKDGLIGWRKESRKIVVVVGDSQPHGAGAAGVAGCTDATKDPHGYDTAAELAEMRAAKRTLVYLVTGVRDITLACASSLAERAYAGGSARLLGDSGLSAAFADLVRSGYAPVTVTPDVVTTARSATDGFTVQVSNPNGFPLDTAAVILRLPKGLSFVAGSSSGTLGRPRVEGGTIEWRLGRALAASETLTGHVVVEADRAGHRTVVGETAVTLPSGFSFVSKSSATIRVMNRLERVELRVGGAVSAGARLRGTATVRRPLVLDPAPRPAWGTLTVTLPRQRALRLDVDSVGFARFAAPVRATLAVDVRSAVGLPGCAPGTRGTVRLVDSARIGSAGPADRVTVTLPASCAAARGTWTGPIVAVTAR